MLTAVVHGQSTLKQEVVSEMAKLRNDLEGLKKKTDNGFKSTHERLDKLGMQLAFLEDDAPTREEHDALENRVKTLDQQTTLI